MLKISRESEINLINILIDQDVISGKDLINIKNKSAEGDKSQIEAVFELNLTDEDKILDILVKEQSLEIADLVNSEITDEVKSILPSNYVGNKGLLDGRKVRVTAIANGALVVDDMSAD